MKLIFKIARTELRNLFFSPVAWFLTLIFFVICAIFYGDSIASTANLQDSLQRTTSDFKQFPLGLTSSIFFGSGFFSGILSNLYLFIPLLTMGLINREFNNGTVKLLYSSPVKLSKIVWGKYLAVMAYNMLLFTIMLLFMLAGAFSIKDIDIGHLCAGLITFYLVVCTYTAIGIFMSSITQYQIVAAIATFILLYFLQAVGRLGQEYDFIRDLTFFLSINGRAERMLKGLITTRDLMYYVLITYLFVTFTYLSLLHGRELVSRTKKAARYLTVFLTVMVVGYLTSRPGYIGYWDGTRTKMNTITEKTQEILKNMQDEPLEVTLYTNLLDRGRGFGFTRPSERNTYVWKIWDKYVRFKPNIKFKYVLYYDVMDNDNYFYKRMPGMSLDSIAKECAKMSETSLEPYLKPAEIRKQINLAPEGMRSVMLLKYKGKSIFLRNYEDAHYWFDEDHLATALKRLSTDKIPKIYASTGNLERSMYKMGEREYFGYSIKKASRKALINHGFEFDSLNLSTQEIPADASALVLADPKIVLNDTVTTRLQQYIGKGGNLLITGEPGKQSVLNPLIQPMGATMMPGALVQVSQHETPDKVVAFATIQHADLLKEKNIFSLSVKAAHEYGDSVKYLHPGVVPLSFTENGFRVRRTMVTAYKGRTWVKMGQLVTDSAAPVMVAAEGDYKLDSFTVGLALSRQVGNKEQRIAIAGDADFMSSLRTYSHVLSQNYLSWMTDEAYPVHLFKIPPTDTLLTISLKAAQTQKLVFVWILPAAVLVFGAVLLIRRKRQ
ncbi:ABC transporter permease subunit [Pseudobacter ginsenosidimutans]|uniref:ABC-2 type transport system permease protein n=1 Tax=Pseudobacter ginsenosidimutans TaxID=661488 RepID=A0A4Q7MYL1_9BACT|nr:Gldg family protein [Pseudobacter ginsenosidimutans]QEC42970.1 ABC transporter permease subunit [Pseudobacter ginsenosidimutans]RZS74320.1 ABC-2 type transport system permease protein [Pseudobacter ginsenosidimutans]